MSYFTSEDPNVVKLQNVPHIFTPILRFTVPAGVVVEWPFITRMVAKLYNSNGEEIDEKSKLYWAFKKSDYFDHPEKLTETMLYRAFKNLGLNEQRSRDSHITVELVDKIKRFLAGAGQDFLPFVQDNVIELYINSPNIVDWTQGSLVELPDVKIRE